MIRSLSLRRAAIRPSSRPRSLLAAAQEQAYSSQPQHPEEDLDLQSVRPAYAPLASPFVALSPTGSTREQVASKDTDCDPRDSHAPDFKNASQRQLDIDDGEALREKTSFFINGIPYGKFTEDRWKQALELIDHWTRVNKLKQTPEAVDQAFVLLDRLVVEQETQEFPEVSMYYLYTNVLRSVVKNWSFCVRKFHSYSLEDQALLRYEYTPMEVLARLEDYSDRSPRLQMDTKTLNMIIEGAGRCSVPSFGGVPNMVSPRVATAFAESLFDRMDADVGDREPDGGGLQPLGQYGNPDRKEVGWHPPSTRPDIHTYQALAHIFATHGLPGRAEALLDRLYKKFTASQNERYRPDVELCTNVLLAWSKSDDPKSGERAETILRRMQELSKCGVQQEPDAIAYNIVLSCWAKCADAKVTRTRRGDEQRAEQCMKRALLLFDEMKEKKVVDTRSYNVMLNVLAKVGRPKEAEGLFRLMRKDYEDGSTNNDEGNPVVEPNRVALNTVLSAWANWGNKHSGDRALKLLDEYERWYREGKVVDKPDRVTLNNVIRCLGRSREPERAEEMLRKMDSVWGINPDAITWNTVLDAYAKANNPQQAEALLEEMYQEFISIQGKKAHMKPDIRTFCTVLDAWRKSKNPKAGERADAILKTMRSLDDAGVLKVAPTAIAYNIVIACWLQSQHKFAPDRAEKILKIMEDEFQNGSNTIRPDAMAYRNVLTAYSHRNLARQAETILERQHKRCLPAVMGGGGNTKAMANEASYNKVLGAYRRSSSLPKAGQSAEGLYKRWQTRFANEEVSFPPTPLSVKLVLETWEEAATRKAAPYPEAAKRAAAFLRYVRDRTFKDDKDEFPGTKEHNFILYMYQLPSCLNAKAAQEYFWAMARRGKPHEKPNGDSLRWVLLAMKNSPGPKTTDQMESLIRQVKGNTELFGFQPTLASYRILLNRWEFEMQPTLVNAKKAESLLEELEQDPHVTLEAMDYFQVVRIWTKLRTNDGIVQADAAFRRMKGLYYGTANDAMKPSVANFKWIITAWKHSQHQAKEESIRNLQAELIFLHGEEALKEIEREHNRPPSGVALESKQSGQSFPIE